jgi:hypothetical protein
MPPFQRKIRSYKVTGKDESSADDILFQVNQLQVQSQARKAVLKWYIAYLASTNLNTYRQRVRQETR